MKKLSILLCLVLFLPAVSLVASEIVVVYTSGGCDVDLHGNGTWRRAEIDMDLLEESVLRTARGGELELDIDGNTISIGPDRTVAVKALLPGLTEKKKFKWLKKATRYTRAVGKDDDQWSETALAGVRGEKVAGEDLEWVVDFEDEELARGKALFQEGDYSEAAGIFRGIIDEKGIGTEDGEAAYYLGFSLFSSLRYEDALPYLTESVSYRDADFYESALMTYSFDQYFLRNYREALEGFTAYTDNFTDSELVPYALLMLGKCYKDMGLKEQARRYFTRVKDDFRGSDVYMDAVEELGDL